MTPDPDVILELMRLHSSAVIPRFREGPRSDEPEREDPCDNCRYYREDPRPAYNTRRCQRHTKETAPMAENKDPLVHLFGTVGKDPVVRQTSKGEVIGFSLAYSTGLDKDSPTIWYDVSTFNEGLIASVKAEVYKGAKIAVEGFLTHREYEGKTYPQIMAFNVFLMEALNRTKREGAYVPAGAAAVAPVTPVLPPGLVMAPPPVAAPAPNDDDLPF